MKITNIILTSSLLTQTVMSKNVVDLKANIEGSLEKRDGDSEPKNLNFPPLGGYGFPVIDKRDPDAKNLVDLTNDFKDLHKRDPDAKNVVDLKADFKEKREGKNIVDLTHGFKDLQKRDGKNVVDLTQGFQDIQKRDPKNVVNLASDIQKRSADPKNIINLELADDTIIILPKRSPEAKVLLDTTTELTAVQKRQAKNILDLAFPEIFKREEPVQQLLTGEHPQTGPTLLTTLLTQHRTISHFSYMLRDNIPLSLRFDDINQKSLVFAPNDVSIEALPKLPWFYPSEINEDTMTEEEVERTKQENVNDFIGKHVVSIGDNYLDFDALNGKELTTEDGLKLKLNKLDNDCFEVQVLKEDGTVEFTVASDEVWTCENGVVLSLAGVLSLPN